MATITTITKSGAGPAPVVPTTAQFKSHVYSKYRELLGSYNDKANEILQTYPAYRVREDAGFALGGETYGGPPQSTIGNSARRLQAQLPAEPPACVQNAMMRRDKQPFTYTPGGIDLSQIKSPRMAKRISRNANSEGVTGQPKVSPLAQNNGSNHNGNGTSNGGSQSSVSPAATLGAAAMGMPFQVFPTGPPAPPPPPPPTGRVVPSNGGNRSIPPPPPPPGPGPSQPTAGSSEARKSPRPQSFEPPPMGMRPEIKIPPNPMAGLRKAPRPQPKNDFWIEEYRREKQQDAPQIPRPVPPSYSYTNRDLDDEVAKNTFNRTDELTVRGDPLAQQKRSPSPSNLTIPLENGSRGSSSIKTPPVYGQSPVPANLPPPITPTKVSPPSTQPSPSTKDTPPPPVRPKPSLSPVSTNQSTNSTTLQSGGSAAKDQTGAGAKNTTSVGFGPAAPPPPPPPPLPSSAHKESQSSASSGVSPSVSSTTSTTGHPTASISPSPSSAKPATTQRPAAQALGSLYIPPIHEVFANSKQSLLTQASPPWMSSRHNSLKEQPEWVHKDELDSAAASSNGSAGSNAQPQSNERQSPQSQLQEQYKPQTSVSPRAPSAPRESVPSTTKSVDSIVTAPTPVSARPSPSGPSQQLTQTNIRPAAADVSIPVHQQSTPVQSAQHYAQQGQQAARSTGPPVAAVSQSTVTMPVNRGYPQQAPVYAQAQPVYSTQSPAGPQKERIIPIQIEKSPVQAPAAAPSFAPPPYYSPNAQYGPASASSSMQSPLPVGFATPHSGFTTPTAMFTNPNHFVNQGYNNISYPPTPTGQPQPHPLYQHHQHYVPPQTPPVLHHPMHPPQPQPQQQQRPPTQQQSNVTNVRIVPIKVEGGEHTVRGPLSNTPAIIQSDPRSSSNAQSWNGNSAPNQSRSFRVLQQITDTLDEAEAEKNGKDQSGSSQPTVADQTDGTKPQQQQQSYGRSVAGPTNAAQQQDMAEGQLRRLQLSNEDKALMNRVKNQVDGEVYLHNEEDPRYRGAAIPSKAFRYLQNMTDSGQAANQSNNGSGNRTQQMFNRGNYNDSDADTQQQYVPPSEQKVEEPKKYTGGSIPSRSFKMLQAMTDAPADPNSSDSEGPSVKLPHGSGTDIRYSPYPYPPQPYFCCPNPNWHYYDPTTNPQYYPPHHPPPPHAPGYYYPPIPPPPPGHYDRGGGYYGGFMSPHHFYYAQEPCSPCTPPPYYQLSQPQTAYCEAIPSEAIHSYVITTPPPRIVVTPTPDDSCSDSELQAIKEQLGELRDVPGEFAGVEPADYGGPIPLTRSQSSLKRLSERLTNFNNGFGEPDGMTKSPVRCSPCSPLNERYRTYEESTSSVPSSQSEASDSEDEGTTKPKLASRAQQAQSNGHAKDVEAVRVNGALSKEKSPQKEKDNDDEEKEDEDEEEEEEEEEEDEEESEDEETVEYGAKDIPPVDEHLPHQLSVIFEEESMYGQSTVASRRTSVCSNSSTLSDCSSTLANDLDDEKDEDGQPSGNRTDDDIDRLDETDMEKSLVSVRLPLKLSFSKSPNNEDIATLVVGESEITGSKEKLTGGSRTDQARDEDSGDESDTEEEDESEEESESSSGEETDTDGEEKKPEATSVVENQSNDADTDVTVTITIPSLSSKVKPNERESLSRPETVKHEAPAKAPFKIDYEEASEVSVSVSLPLKPKGSSSSDITKQSEQEASADTKSQKEDHGNDAGGEEEEEVDFWSQIGDEDDYQRPVRSYSRDMWSSREFSVDRQSVWSQDAEEDEEASTTGTTDFWSAENGPTEASDLWNFGKRNSPLPASSDKDKTGQEDSKDSLEYWQKENERLVKDLYERRASGIGCQGVSASSIVKDENNNKTCVTKDTVGGVQPEPQSDRKTEDHSEEEAEDGSDSESDNDSEEYETSNTSKEDSEAEQDVGEPLSKQVESNDPLKKPKDDSIMQSANGIADIKAVSMTQEETNVLDKMERDKKLTVKERISLFETQAVSVPTLEVTPNSRGTVTPTMGNRLRPLSRQRQLCEESEAEDDSGVTSDMSKHISEVETDSECFPEMRKMTRYQRAATHSRLFKLLQDESNNGDSEDEEEASEDNSKEQEQNRSSIKHEAAAREESTIRTKVATGTIVNGGSSRKTPEESNGTEGRRDRLTLPISHQSSSGNDSLSSSTSSASPVSGTLQNEKLAEELVQSLLMKKKGRLFRNLPLEKLHAAALKILQEDLESNGTISSTEDNMATVDSTPALTPQEFKSEYPTSYADYYDTWCSDTVQPNGCYSDTGSDCGMVKMFRTVPEHQLALAKKDSRMNAGNGHWSPRCPRVFSNKNVPRLMGVREAELVEPRGSRPPSRASSNRSPFTVIPPATGLLTGGSPMDDCPNRATVNRQFKLQ
ncbi:uncharacterized protein LOC118509335 isoform X3 [Anopheles stephensi]|uniref:uncharacterized protein LOC118509335 isoform X3 n=1 Tax=Anopheles stephensi TaxID=30069 RepID=UPI001658B9FA|nr:uncharacterized protein LOC118509335 isoform X3 [Anopheles stephensi]